MTVLNSKIYRQADSRWTNLPYPTKAYKFGSNACGACSVLHCAIELENFKNMMPPEIREYMVQFATEGHGTLWNGITKGLEHYGFNVHWNRNDSMSTIFKILSTSLKKGVILFGSTKGPDGTVWTTGGHYIGFEDYKIQNGKHWFYLKDSRGRKHDKWWCYEKSMRGDVRQVWICTSLKPGYKLLGSAPSATAPAKPTAPTTVKKYTGTIPTPTLRSGSRGTKVTYLQKFLNWFGNYGLKVDGIFGKATKAALQKFQKKVGLKADGIYGTLSYGKAKAYKQVSP
jgi:hypothetical protein